MGFALSPLLDAKEVRYGFGGVGGWGGGGVALNRGDGSQRLSTDSLGCSMIQVDYRYGVRSRQSNST